MPAWVLAIVSSVHVALAVVRQHRTSPGGWRLALLLVSYTFAALPWTSAEARPLAAGEAGGVGIPSLCRAGVCARSAGA